nr:MAG: hypothetical protein DIU70_14855 [Bacillota bacterium]
MKRLLVLAMLAILGVILAGVVMALASPPGLEAHLTGEEMSFAQYAFHTVKYRLFEGPTWEKALILRLKIEALERAPQVPGQRCGDLPFATETEFRAIVRAETLFGLTFARAEVQCDNVSRIRTTGP